MPPSDPARPAALPEPTVPEAVWTRMPGAAFRLDADFRWISSTESIEALTGRSAHSWLADATALERAVHPLDRARHVAHRRSLPQQTGCASLRFRLLHAKSGAVIWVHEFCLPEFDAAGKISGYAGLWIDNTRAARLEQNLADSAWTETLAAMTGGMAHDFNNVLTGMVSLSEHFLAQLPLLHPFRENLTLLHESGLGASRWIQRFALLQQSSPSPATWHDANALVADTLEILRHTLSRRYELTAQCWAEPVPVVVEAVGFQRALLMLAFREVRRMSHPGPVRLKVLHDSAPDDDAASWVNVGVEIAGERGLSAISDETDAALSAAGKFAARYRGRLTADQRTTEGTITWLHFPSASADSGAPETTTSSGHCWLLLGGATQKPMDAWASWLREQSYLVTTSAPDDAVFPSGDDYLWDAAVIIIDAQAPDAAMTFLEHVRDSRPELPVVTVLPEGIAVEVEAHFGQITTLVAAGDNQRARLLEKLAAARSGS